MVKTKPKTKYPGGKVVVGVDARGVFDQRTGGEPLAFHDEACFIVDRFDGTAGVTAHELGRKEAEADGYVPCGRCFN